MRRTAARHGPAHRPCGALAGACAAEPPASLPFVSRAFATNFSSEPGGGPPIEGGSAAGSYLAGRFALESGDMRRPPRAWTGRWRPIPRISTCAARCSCSGSPAASSSARWRPRPPGRERRRRGRAVLLLALDRVRAGKHAQARDLLERVSERGATGLVQPMLLAWAAFGAGDAQGGAGQDRRRRARSSRSICSAATIAPLMLGLSRRPADAAPLLEGEAGRPGGAPLRITRAWPRSAWTGRPRRCCSR